MIQVYHDISVGRPPIRPFPDPKPMKAYIGIAQIAVSILLIVSVLLQARGTGLGAAFGGEGNVYRTKRGVEKVLFRATIVLAVLFIGLALAAFLVPGE